jgi:glycosyltransferase involved in cell wall biosynthesis
MMSKLKLYIDGQFFQTQAWDRGMGRYTVSLLRSLYDVADDLECVFIFSNNLPREAKVTRQIAAQHPSAQLVHLDLKSTENSSYKAAAKHNKAVLDTFIQEQDTPEDVRQVFMIPCLFQEPTASTFPEGVESCLIYYDAIPLLYYSRYKDVINYENYLQRHQCLYQADKIFSISQTIADDLALYYGMATDDTHVINIDGACIEGMFDKEKKPARKLPEQYVLLTTSNDIRKNNRAAVRAFDQLSRLTNLNYKLVITSFFSAGQRAELHRLSDDLIFTGNISDEELAWLYRHAEVVLFASEYEGLGLPLLEAVKMGKKVACSNIPVFREISEEAFYFFDPLDADDIMVKLQQALRGDNWAEKKKLYSGINKHYTWKRSAGIVYKTFCAPQVPVATNPKLRVAILAPTPEGYSAVGKVVQELHATISKYFNVDYYFENRKEKEPVHVRPNYLRYIASCYDVEDFNARTYREYDAVIYHVGNSEYCFYTILNALHLPGIAIFHDTVLKEAFGEMTRLGFLLPQRFEAEARLDTLNNSTNAAFLTSIANNQIAGVTHSSYARDAILPLLSEGTEIVRAELPVPLPAQNVQSQRREMVHIGLAGVLGGRKGLDIIKELASDEALSKQAILHVFGFSFVDPESVKELKSYENVRLMTNLSDLEYQMQLANLDILINYRSEYRGETSLTVLEAIRYGCVAIVNKDLGWFSELPDDCVVKVNDHVELIQAVQQLVASRPERERIGNAAKAYAATVHSPDAYVRIFDALIRANHQTPNRLRAQAIRASTSVTQILKLYKDIEGAEA